MGPFFRTATTRLLRTSNLSFLYLFLGNCYKHLCWLPSLGAKTCLKPKVPGETRADVSDVAYRTQGHCARGQLCRIFHQHVLRRQSMRLHFLYHGLFCSKFYCGLSQVLAVVCKIRFSSTPCFPSCHLHLNPCTRRVRPWTGVSSVLPAGV